MMNETSAITIRCTCRISAALLVLLVSFGCQREDPPGTKQSTTATSSTEDWIGQAKRHVASGRYDNAWDSVQRALIHSPDKPAVVFLAAEIAAARRETDQAIELAEKIPLADARYGKRAADLRLQQLLAAGRDDIAVADLRQIIEKQPTEPRWRHLSWRVLHKHGRCQEASVHAEQLCMLGKANLAEVMSLIERNAPFPRVMKLEDAKRIFASGLGLARWHFIDGSHKAGLDTLDAYRESGFPDSASAALYGRILAETQDWDAFAKWHQELDDAAHQWSDYWAAIGTRLMAAGKHEAATRAFLEAITRDKTDRSSYRRAYQTLAALERTEDAQEMLLIASQIQRSQQLLEQIEKSPNDRGHWQDLAAWLTEIGRPYEAIQWYMNVLPASAARQRLELDQYRVQLNTTGYLENTVEEIQLASIDPTQFSLQPDLDSVLEPSTRSQSQLSAPNESSRVLAVPRLVDVASEIGVEFQWKNDRTVDLNLLALYESLGGGIAVLDFDLDGWPDLYLGQGAGRPPAGNGSASNEMFRNVAGRFDRVTRSSTTEDTGYTQGIAVGDLNQDGFPDLFLGAIGKNRVLINNGDGTFRDRTERLGNIADRFTTSVAIADLNGDALPEIIEVNYLRWEDAFAEPNPLPDGTYKIPGPANREPEIDRWYQCSRNGRWEAKSFTEESRIGSGLGILVGELNGNPGNEVFIANDAKPNHFWIRQDDKWINAADSLGLAHGFEGLATAAMGITAGDFNRDERVDLHVTNFNNEPSNLYLRSDGPAFADSAVRYGLDRPTRPMVGFGTKAIDFDRNGWPDIAITNGHVFAELPEGQQFAMPPQVIMNHGDRFELVDLATECEYFANAYVGRSMACLDFDRDGRMDVAIGHLDQPLAILHNETQTRGRFLELELIATAGERTSVGAKVTVYYCGDRSVHWVTSGGGFLSSDESLIDVGIGLCDTIERVDVQWPSGQISTFQDLRPNARYLLVENAPEPFPRTAPGESP